MDQSNAALEAAASLISKGQTKSEAKRQLKSNGYSSPDVELFTEQAHRGKILRNRKRGWVLGIMGITLLSTGFFLTAFLFHLDQSIDLTLYGMASAGVILLLLGMVDRLGQ